jgi:hypothetical protein
VTTPSQVTGKKAKRLRERFINHLDPSLRQEEWRPEEDELILKLVNEKGQKWSAIAELVKGRSVK